jgi:hypothetical protein
MSIARHSLTMLCAHLFARVHPDGFHINASCDANVTVPVLSKLCIGKNNCSIEASSAAFGLPAGQPCYGTRKSLAAQIQCTGDPPPPPPSPNKSYKRCGLVAEFDVLTLGCPSGKTIDSVVMASFGTPSGSCTCVTLHSYVFHALLC